MRRPSWLRPGRRRQAEAAELQRLLARRDRLLVSLEQSAKLNPFAGPTPATETLGDLKLQSRILGERLAGAEYVRAVADQACADLGWDPEVFREQDRARARAERRARLLERQDPKHPDFIGARP